MGISGLLGLLKSIQKPCRLDQFRNETLGVDAYCWLHRGAVAAAVDLAQGKPTSRHVDFAMHRVRMLLHFGVKPYLVFDGDCLPSKGGTERARADRRRESKANGLRLLEAGKSMLAFQELQKAVDVTPEMAAQLIEVLKQHNIPYVVAPYEADAQLAYLERNGFIQGIISEDSDLLVFGAQKLITKLDQYGECLVINKDDFTACKEVNLSSWTIADLRYMAILSGCDYLTGIHRMGLKTAYRMVRKYKTIDRIIRGIQLDGKFTVPADYIESFTRADMTFLYQWVFCPKQQQLVYGNTPANPDMLAGVECIGKYVEAPIAREVASGLRDPITKEFFRPPLFQRNSTSIEDQHALKKTPGKSIDAFFKPHRVPLAELDPNSLTPISERAMSVESRRRSQNAAPLHERVSNPSSASRAANTASNPSKRAKLCDEMVDAKSPRVQTACKSRFFSANNSYSSPSTGILTGRMKRRRNPTDFQIFSDDSYTGDLNQALTAAEQERRQSEVDQTDAIWGSNSTANQTEQELRNTKQLLSQAPEKSLEDNDSKSRAALDSPGSISQYREHHTPPGPRSEVSETILETPDAVECIRREESSIEETPPQAIALQRSPLEQKHKAQDTLRPERRRQSASINLNVGQRGRRKNLPKPADFIYGTSIKGSEHFLQRSPDQTRSSMEEIASFSDGHERHPSEQECDSPPLRRRLDLSQYVFALAN